MDRHSSLPNRRVFLSYALEDSAVATIVRQRLRDEGLEVWSADSVPAGERWGAAIQRELAAADDVVVLLSKAARTSPGLLVEVGAAVAAAESHDGRRVIPIAVDDLPPTGLLASFQWLRGDGMSPTQVADGIIEALSAPTSAVSKATARAEELQELRNLEAALRTLREGELLVATRRTRLIGLFLVVALLAAVAATVVALWGGTEILGAGIASTLGATVGLLGSVIGFVAGRQASGRNRE